MKALLELAPPTARVLSRGEEVDIPLSQVRQGQLVLVKPGDYVNPGQDVFELHADSTDRFEAALATLDGALRIGDGPPEPSPIVIEKVS